MSNCPQAMTPASIRYLLVLDDLCREGRGVRSVEIAARMNVSKPSAHSMLQNLCQAGLVEKERYGTVFLTPEGRRAAADGNDIFFHFPCPLRFYDMICLHHCLRDHIHIGHGTDRQFFSQPVMVQTRSTGHDLHALRLHAL